MSEGFLFIGVSGGEPRLLHALRPGSLKQGCCRDGARRSGRVIGFRVGTDFQRSIYGSVGVAGDTKLPVFLGVPFKPLRNGEAWIEFLLVSPDLQRKGGSLQTKMTDPNVL